MRGVVGQQASLEFNVVDPVHKDLPAKMVRKQAASLIERLGAKPSKPSIPSVRADSMEAH